ncbi:hypothetical protein COOONC_13277, partial [Cooperia oncophora]
LAKGNSWRSNLSSISSSRKESELCDLVAVTELWCCRKYRSNISRTRATLTYLGNWKYGSTETLTGKEATAIDDIISCIYIMTEFALGQIPWHKETEKQDEKGSVLLNHYSKLFEWLKQQPLVQTINYEALYEEILRMPDQSGQTNPGEQSLFGFSNPLLDAYDHGFTEKKTNKDNKLKDKEGSGKKRRKTGNTSSVQNPPKSKMSNEKVPASKQADSQDKDD